MSKPPRRKTTEPSVPAVPAGPVQHVPSAAVPVAVPAEAPEDSSASTADTWKSAVAKHWGNGLATVALAGTAISWLFGPAYQRTVAEEVLAPKLAELQAAHRLDMDKQQQSHQLELSKLREEHRLTREDREFELSQDPCARLRAVTVAVQERARRADDLRGVQDKLNSGRYVLQFDAAGRPLGVALSEHPQPPVESGKRMLYYTAPTAEESAAAKRLYALQNLDVPPEEHRLLKAAIESWDRVSAVLYQTAPRKTPYDSQEYRTWETTLQTEQAALTKFADKLSENYRLKCVGAKLPSKRS